MTKAVQPDADKTLVPLFVAGMLICGSVNVLMTKYQDSIVVGTNADGSPITFLHPVLQTAIMFAGEALCLFAYLIYWHLKHYFQPSYQHPPLLATQSMLRLDQMNIPAPGRWKRRLQRYLVFAIPMLCDVTASTTLNLGLYLTYASTFQMLRGTLVLFTGMMTVLLLRRFPKSYQWTGMGCIAGGAFIVGLASVMAAGSGSMHAPNPLLGNILCFCAQLGTATQIVIEEKFMKRYRCHPVLAVGLEGVWGLTLCTLLIPYLGKLSPNGIPFDDVHEGMRQVLAHPELLWTSVLGIFLIAIFNVCGMQVTHKVSGAARSTIDATRTIVVWTASLTLGWESFHVLTLPGFLMLLFGSTLYNEVIRLPSVFKYSENADIRPVSANNLHEGIEEETVPLLQGEDVEGEEEGGDEEGGRALPQINENSASNHAIPVRNKNLQAATVVDELAGSYYGDLKMREVSH